MGYGGGFYTRLSIVVRFQLQCIHQHCGPVGVYLCMQDSVCVCVCHVREARWISVARVAGRVCAAPGACAGLSCL